HISINHRVAQSFTQLVPLFAGEYHREENPTLLKKCNPGNEKCHLLLLIFCIKESSPKNKI
ncbi:MAG: hypothetical protein U9R19_09975, partial [Bacteroidota bacterium]|nr:hypothetical protein [Bacteroidota bacterium]